MPAPRLGQVYWVSLAILWVLLSPHNSLLGQTPAQTGATPLSFEDLARQATAAREAGRADEAIRDYQRAVGMRPDWDEGWWYLGTIYYDSDRYAEAIPAFKSLVAVNPKLGPAWALLGLSEFETKDYQNSLPHLERAQELGFDENPEIVKVAKYHIALLLNLNGRFDQATSLLVAAFGTEHLSEQIKVALGMALLHVPLLPDQIDRSKDALIHAAGETAALLAQGSSAQAIQAFQQMLKDYPDAPGLHYAYGSALASLSRYAEAQTQLREEIRVTPGSALPHILMASIALKMHHPQEALPSAERAVKLAPQSAATHEVLRQTLLALGRTGAAAKELEAATKLGTGDPQLDGSLARVYARSSVLAPAAAAPPTGKEPGNVSAAGSAEVSGSGNFEQLARRAAVARDAGQTSEAIRYYQEALQARPQWEEGLRYLGALYYGATRYGEAIPVLKQLVELNPRLGSAWAILGLCEFQAKDYKNSLLHLQHGRDLGIAGSEQVVDLANYHLALLLNLSGEFDGAMDLLIPMAGRAAWAEQIKVAMGIALLRIPLPPDQIDPAQSGLIHAAGEAAAFLSESKYDRAFPIFQQLLKDYPNTPFLHLAYGMALASLSQYDEAQAQLGEETRVSPKSALAYISLASIGLRVHRPGESLASAERAVELAPQSFTAHYVLGRTLLELGNTGRAVKELETASQLEPQSPEVHFNLARAYAKAKLPDQADRERATFTRLNALVERQKSMHGTQSYGGSRDRGQLAPSEVKTAPPSNQE